MCGGGVTVGDVEYEPTVILSKYAVDNWYKGTQLTHDVQDVAENSPPQRCYRRYSLALIVENPFEALAKIEARV